MADSKCDVWDTGIDAVGFSNASFARFAHFITAELGIKMPESQFEMVRRKYLLRNQSKIKGTVRIVRELRKKVNFHQLNHA